MASPLERSLSELSDSQRKAVDWNDEALLVLSGLGAGKTRVLSCRIAQLLHRSREERFRVLALTSTNKAAHEMRRRVAALVPGLEERADIHTFHGFCAQVLRQHGVHLDIKPNFAIYSRTSDRQAVLEDALGRDAYAFDCGSLRIVPMIDSLKARLIGPEDAEEQLSHGNAATRYEAGRVSHAYRVYEEELRRTNALDCNSLIFKAYELFGYPALVQHYQTVYPYWLVDEFQNTRSAQYTLLRRMASNEFRRVFAVADDDKAIYEWNGASTLRISALVEDFDCAVLQLPTNVHCPPRIVEAANRLAVYNVRRNQPTQPAESTFLSSSIDSQQVERRVFDSDTDEVKGIAHEIAGMELSARGRTLVVARTQALLDPLRLALKSEGVRVSVSIGRDCFGSPQMRWMVACLKQFNRPRGRHDMATLVGAFGNFAPSPIDFDDLLLRSDAEETTYLAIWTAVAQAASLPSPADNMVGAISDLVAGKETPEHVIHRILEHLETDDCDSDLKVDLSTWRRLSQEIKTSLGPVPLARFLQELESRSKEPVAEPGAVSVATLHGAKGLGVDTVYLIGLAEGILPSWHSIKKGSDSTVLEAERRGCFLHITRAKQHLILSRAKNYGGLPKRASRFLREMGVIEESPTMTRIQESNREHR